MREEFEKDVIKRSNVKWVENGCILLSQSRNITFPFVPKLNILRLDPLHVSALNQTQPSLDLD